MRWMKLGLGALMLSLSLAGVASATTLLRADVGTLTRISAAVVRGKVSRIQSRWSGDKLRILTDVDIEVTEAIKGPPAKTVRVVQPGGQVGDIAQSVEGLASFGVGEDVVVFLEARVGASFVVAGMAQGKYRVSRDAAGKEIATPDDIGQARVLDPATRGEITVRRDPLALDSLRAAVRGASKAPVAPGAKGGSKTP